MKKVCEICGKEFDLKKYKKKKFCSKKCISKNMSNSKKLLWENEEYKNKMSEQSKKLWSDPDYIKKTIKTRTDECKKKISDKAKERWKDENFKEKMINYFNSEENKEKISHRFLNLWKNDGFINSIIKNGKIYKKYTLPSGRVVNIQGYENRALDILLKKYDENDIHIGILEINKIDSFYYTDKIGKVHRYFPDFYIKTTNKIIEVKSDWTYQIDIEINELKKQSCLNKGYEFEFMII